LRVLNHLAQLSTVCNRSAREYQLSVASVEPYHDREI
jgi:hypothetical protein